MRCRSNSKKKPGWERFSIHAHTHCFKNTAIAPPKLFLLQRSDTSRMNPIERFKGCWRFKGVLCDNGFRNQVQFR